MKIFSLIILLTIVYGLKAQDTIYVSNETTSYLTITDVQEILTADIGRIEQYAAKIEGNNLFLKATKEDAVESTLFIITSKGSEGFILIYKKRPPQYFYRKAILTENQQKYTVRDTVSKLTNDGIDNPDKQSNSSEINDRLKTITGGENIYHSLATIKNRITIAVTAIGNDSDYYFLKIVFQNNSTVDYSIDIVNFTYSESFNKGLFIRKSKSDNHLFPLIKPINNIVKGNTSRTLGYVLPLFALTSKGSLSITFRENSGNRLIRLTIDDKYLSQSIKLN